MRGYCGIGLDNPKHSINIGSAIRAASNYNAAFLAVRGNRYNMRASTDTMKQYRHLPCFRVEDLADIIPFDCVPVAVDIISDASSLFEYKHPERAFYIFGAEDATLGKRVTDWCRDTIYIPTKGCMNLAASVNVILYDRLCKQQKRIKKWQRN